MHWRSRILISAVQRRLAQRLLSELAVRLSNGRCECLVWRRQRGCVLLPGSVVPVTVLITN